MSKTSSAAPQPGRRDHRLSLRRAWNRLVRAAGILGLGLTAASGVSSAAPVPPPPIPQHWISYAQLAGNQFQVWLSDPDNQVVQRLHAWMQERVLGEAQSVPPAPLIVRVWMDDGGKVSRLEFASLGQQQADDDLRGLLTAQPLPEPPPRDMRQPMVLQLELSFVAKP